jgi:hypothetical protein
MRSSGVRVVDAMDHHQEHRCRNRNKRRAVMKLLQDDLAHDAASALWTDARPMRSAFAILEGPSPSAFS